MEKSLHRVGLDWDCKKGKDDDSFDYNDGHVDGSAGFLGVWN